MNTAKQAMDSMEYVRRLLEQMQRVARGPAGAGD